MRYFVSFNYTDGHVSGFGNLEITMNVALTSTVHIRQAEEHLKEELMAAQGVENPHVIILWWTPLPDDGRDTR